MGINALSSHSFFFRLSGAHVSGGDYRAAFSQRNATNLVSKAAQLVADLESIRSDARIAQEKTFTARIETLIDSFEIDFADYDNGFTLPDLLRGQGIDLQS